MLTTNFRIRDIAIWACGLVIALCVLVPINVLAETDRNDRPSDDQVVIPGPVSPAGTSPAAAGKSDGWPQALGLLSSREITIESPRLTINLPDKGGVASVTVTSGQALTPLLTMIKKLAFKKVHLKDGTFVFRTPSGFTQTIYGVDATITGDKDSSIRTATGRFKFRGEELSFEVSSLNPSGKSDVAGFPISFLLNGDNLHAQLAGNINITDGFGVEGKLQLSLPDVKFVSAWLGYPLSDKSETLELKADGAFSWKGSVLSFIDAQFVMGGNEAKGAVSMDLSGSRPRIDGTIALENVDISHYWPGLVQTLTGSGKSSDDAPVVTAEKGGLSRDVSLDLGYLNEFDADFRLSAENANLGSITAQDCAVTITLKSGDLIVGLVESKIAGGMVHGEIDLKKSDANHQAYLRADLENVAIEKIVKALKFNSPVSGTANIKLDLGGYGANIAEITKTVSGEAHLTMNDQLELKLDTEMFKSLPDDKEALKWWLKLLSGARFATMRNVLKIDKGQAVSRSFVMRGVEFDVIGEGTLNLSHHKIALRLRRMPPIQDDQAKGSQDDQAKGSARFQDGSADQILIHGSWSRPSLHPQDGDVLPEHKQKGRGTEKHGTRDADRSEKVGGVPDKG